MVDDDHSAAQSEPAAGKTYFASAARSSPEEIAHEIEHIRSSVLVDTLLEAADGMLAVLNQHRQMVALNTKLLDSLGIENPAAALGLRFGEAVGCRFATDNPAGGCGTGPTCASCGAAIAIVSALTRERPMERMCCVQTEQDGRTEDLYLAVKAHPIRWNDQRWVLLFLSDRSDIQRSRVLQRVFFHDVSNLIIGLVGATYSLKRQVPAGLESRVESLQRQVSDLSREVLLQRVLLQEESEEVSLVFTPVAVDGVLAELHTVYRQHPAGEGKQLRVVTDSSRTMVQTEPVVLGRVLTNMLVNALEATERGGTVEVWSELAGDRVLFRVANPGEIPKSIEGRIFQRNFSTKEGPGRGLGTYSMRLFGERFLGGEVSFDCGEGRTVFTLSLPLV